jgi:hypothetical protein
MSYREERYMDDTKGRVDFANWLKRANQICENMVGLSLDDLPDGPSWDSWDAGVEADIYVTEILSDNGYDLGIFESNDN